VLPLQIRAFRAVRIFRAIVWKKWAAGSVVGLESWALGPVLSAPDQRKWSNIRGIRF
jgi:hypothetical protein